ncbi:MAG: hypothetical protein HQK59_12685, partial [Deltaproteobacteria bacterium]|nr:hypothetical protein [Deltaproteobacteria bacterium]
LSLAAGRLEQSIDQGKTEQWNTLVTQVEEQMALVLASINLLEQSRPAEVQTADGVIPGHRVDVVKVALIMTELSDLLKRNILDTAGRLKLMGEHLKGSPLFAKLSIIEADVFNLDYEKALSGLEALAGEIANAIGARANE